MKFVSPDTHCNDYKKRRSAFLIGVNRINAEREPACSGVSAMDRQKLTL